ncbi:MAG: hypothetical protein A2Z11_02495 [Candidatus Woykebacteria bacterium RBG_16_43_9]|uniref:Cupin 2 conserved barrel domain-containing protein n=1 Tax=Candidatus Woykebacteria bacterium RBG_16_43_9 TaxID=1802596 RepID=A0A1G1WGU0_9BACT|nr:MAG: hypothetical protein A2Z11_02495 [Candidatus Woykebacteria bacterium RBG_16_43_9]
MAVVPYEVREAPFFHFIDEKRQIPTTILLGSEDEQVLQDKLEAYGDGWFQPLIIDLDGRTYHLALKGFEITEGERSYSGDSQAIYWAKCDLGSYGFLIQYLPPRAQTSRHYHEKIIETFFPIAGTCFVSNKRRRVEVVSGLCVLANKTHQITTEADPALNLVLIDGPDPIGNSDHHYVT